MNTVFAVLWFVFVAPDGSADYQMKLEPTIEVCHVEGGEVAKEAQAAVDSKELSTYYGGCTEVTQDAFDALHQDVKGSI